MKILVEMGFRFGDQHFSPGTCSCNDVDVIRHMKRLGYGKVIASEDARSEVVVEKPAEEKPKAETKKAPVKRTTKKASKK